MAFNFDLFREQIDRDLTERISHEALRLADDLSQPFAHIKPPPRPTYIDFEAARLVGYAICRNVTTEEFFYQPIRQ